MTKELYNDSDNSKNCRHTEGWGSILWLTICRAITEYSTSIGLVSSYNEGASHNIIKVPTNEAIIKIHKNRRSNTIATKPQS
uniref:Uncharacterized protein n=1 Tax=Glossina palpalis gambiensis TaxID=67801 RepID=A0A1B0BF24_9MUSC